MTVQAGDGADGGEQPVDYDSVDPTRPGPSPRLTDQLGMALAAPLLLELRRSDYERWWAFVTAVNSVTEAVELDAADLDLLRRGVAETSAGLSPVLEPEGYVSDWTAEDFAEDAGAQPVASAADDADGEDGVKGLDLDPEAWVGLG